mgnify:CR=1 FL=1
MKLKELLRSVPQVGRLEWIGVRPAKGEPMETLEEVALLEERGLAGDRKARRRGGKRQISLIQAEHLPLIAELAGREGMAPALLRRNFVVAGINLLSLRTARFTIGDALLEGSGYCAPCAKMETALGPGGFSAMRGHGGILARVLEAATVRRGDEVRFVDVTEVSSPTS